MTGYAEKKRPYEIRVRLNETNVWAKVWGYGESVESAIRSLLPKRGTTVSAVRSKDRSNVLTRSGQSVHYWRVEREQ